MVLFGVLTMKRLWVFIILGLMIMVQPVYSTSSVNVKNSVVSADDVSSSLIRVYGENVAADIYEDLTVAQYRNIVQKFAENGTRWILDARMATEGANALARQYLVQELALLSNGRIEIELVGTFFNVVGKLPGYLPGNNPVIVVSAHYDSAEFSPGANCDGSGIATMLSLARMLSKYEWPLDIYFIAFNGLFTQIPMLGSPEVASMFEIAGIEILTMYNADTLLVQDPLLPTNERIQIGYLQDMFQEYYMGQYWAEMARMMSNNYGLNYVVPIPSINLGIWQTSDHYSFIQRGFTGILCVYESGGGIDGSSSTSNDRWNNVEYDYEIGREATAVIGASIAFTMSRRYGAPTQLNHSFSKGPGQFEMILFAITTPTIVNISSRWFGGSSTYYLVDSDFNLIDMQEFNEASAWEPTQVFSQYLTTEGTYRLFVQNTVFRSVGYEISITYDTDIDGNGIIDQDEYWLAPSYFTSDQDNDEVSDADEIFLGTDLNNFDSDDDTMPDKYEIDMGFDPTDPSDGSQDADSDGLSNAQEYTGGLNPFSSDSDQDGMDDLWELTYGLNPLVDDAALDLDEDNITNLEEYLAGTNPQTSNLEQIPLIWFASPVVVIAPIVGLLYLRRRENQLLS